MNKIYWLAILFFLLLISLMDKKVQETLIGGKYPYSVDNPLLAGWYDVYKHPKYDKNGATQIWVNYPQFNATHCTTNNIKYWRRPTNGQCTPPGMCMGLYKPTKQDIPPALPVPPLYPSDGNSRVNYYVSKD